MRIHKNMIMKKIITIAILVLILASTTVMLFGCSNREEYENEYFRYMYNKEKDGVIILDVADSAKQEDILVFPEKIDGLPVIQLGQFYGRAYIPPEYIYGPECNVKKIYWNSNCVIDSIYLKSCDIVFGINTKLGRWNYCGKEVDFGSNILCANDFDKIFSSYRRYDVSLEEYAVKVSPNIKFYVEEELYFIDVTNRSKIYELEPPRENNLYIAPENPKKEGKEFVGWYHEKEGINKWNTEYPDSYEEELNLYAIFK